MTVHATGPLVVLDDDPTGTQAVADVPVLLRWDARLVADAARSGAPAVYLLTNSRAYAPARARELVRDAAAAAVQALGRPRLVLRGDSTLRTHLLEEYLAVSEAAFEGGTPPLLLVPALPAAGRVTVGGVHLLERDGARVPLHATEYARDPSFAYGDSRLLHWADDRSGGLFAAAAGREVPLERLRAEGAPAVAAALAELAEAGAPAVCVPDAETGADLELVADGLRAAEAAGVRVLVRSAPAFAAILAGAAARGLVPTPAVGDGGLLVVCGSWVPNTTRQLAVLAARRPGSLVEVDAAALGSAGAESEVERAAWEAGERLAAGRLAVVATGREGPGAGWSLELGARIARNLARVAALVAPAPDAVLAKGGVTAAVTAAEGLGAARAEVVGPVADGVALWRLAAADGRTVPYVVFPGNVGGDEALADLVDEMMRG
jgi:uncharacterized protein YgbK (DUF1537 family)